jgi:hypothetical protein
MKRIYDLVLTGHWDHTDSVAGIWVPLDPPVTVMTAETREEVESEMDYREMETEHLTVRPYMEIWPAVATRWPLYPPAWERPGRFLQEING